jgi:hypothetical protein
MQHYCNNNAYFVTIVFREIKKRIELIQCFYRVRIIEGGSTINTLFVYQKNVATGRSSLHSLRVYRHLPLTMHTLVCS